MMKRSTYTALIFLLLLAGIGAFGYSRIYGCGGMATSECSSHGAAQSATTEDRQQLAEIRKELSTSFGQMTRDFEQLEKQFKKAMKMDNLSDLNTALQEHQAMMAAFDQQWTEHDELCRAMLSRYPVSVSPGSNSPNAGDHSHH